MGRTPHESRRRRPTLRDHRPKETAMPKRLDGERMPRSTTTGRRGGPARGRRRHDDPVRHDREDVDASPLLRGLPDDRCPCPHWGYVFTGRLTFTLRRPRGDVRGRGRVLRPAAGTSRRAEPGPSTSSSARPRSSRSSRRRCGRTWRRCSTPEPEGFRMGLDCTRRFPDGPRLVRRGVRFAASATRGGGGVDAGLCQPDRLDHAGGDRDVLGWLVADHLGHQLPRRTATR